MAVDSKHRSYENMIDLWMDMRATREGERAVKDAGTRFLPKLGGHADPKDGAARYAAYKQRASYYNATGRTIDGLSGMVFRKDPLLEHPTGMDELMEDVTLNGVSLNAFSEQCVEEVLVAGRAGVLIDMPRAGDEVRTRADEARMNMRPFWSLYEAENITNWTVGQVGNKAVLLQVRLYETVDERGDDEFSSVEVNQYRVLSLGAEDNGGALTYTQRLFRKSDDTGEWYQYGDTIIPTVAGSPIDYIPFVFLGVRDTTPRVDRPPLIDLAHVNLSHYRTSADLEHGAHFTALPTPYLFGVKDDDTPGELGPEALWHSETEGSSVSAGMLEFTGSGLGSLEKRLEHKENQMAALGARMLAPDKRQVEAAETAEIHRMGEISVLASLAKAVSIGLGKVMEITRDWMGLTGPVSVTLNTDYIPANMDPAMLLAMLKAVQQGDLSRRSFFENLQRGEIVRADKTYEEEQEEIDADPPSTSFGAGFGFNMAGGAGGNNGSDTDDEDDDESDADQ